MPNFFCMAILGTVSKNRKSHQILSMLLTQFEFVHNRAFHSYAKLFYLIAFNKHYLSWTNISGDNRKKTHLVYLTCLKSLFTFDTPCILLINIIRDSRKKCKLHSCLENLSLNCIYYIFETNLPLHGRLDLSFFCSLGREKLGLNIIFLFFSRMLAHPIKFISFAARSWKYRDCSETKS